MLNHIRSYGCERYPRREHWQALKSLSDSLMEPQEFLRNWKVTYRDLGKIAGCSESTVAGWFCSGERGNRRPNDLHKLRLAIVHKLWSKI